jgi:hypothetical protein
LNGVFVNVVDLVDAAEAGKTVTTFANRSSLVDYIRSTEKIFPLRRAKKDSRLRLFLVHAFSSK